MGDRQRNTGETNTRTNIEDLIWSVAPHTSKNKGISQVAVDDTRGLEWSQAARLNPFRGQPLAIPGQRAALGIIEPYPGPGRCSVEPIVDMFPVKHVN